jgi:hypothetical protein
MRCGAHQSIFYIFLSQLYYVHIIHARARTHKHIHTRTHVCIYSLVAQRAFPEISHSHPLFAYAHTLIFLDIPPLPLFSLPLSPRPLILPPASFSFPPRSCGEYRRKPRFQKHPARARTLPTRTKIRSQPGMVEVAAEGGCGGGGGWEEEEEEGKSLKEEKERGRSTMGGTNWFRLFGAEIGTCE